MGGSDRDVLVNTFIQDCNFATQFIPTNLKTIKIEDFSDYDIVNFFKRCACFDLNKTVKEKLDHSSSKWLIIDSRVMSYGIKTIEYKG